MELLGRRITDPPDCGAGCRILRCVGGRRRRGYLLVRSKEGRAIKTSAADYPAKGKDCFSPRVHSPTDLHSGNQADIESQMFADDVATALRAGRWTITRVNAEYEDPPRGVVLVVGDERRLPDGASELLVALREVGVVVNVQGLGGGEGWELRIGPRLPGPT